MQTDAMLKRSLFRFVHPLTGQFTNEKSTEPSGALYWID